jgi:hypothetical protein
MHRRTGEYPRGSTPRRPALGVRGRSQRRDAVTPTESQGSGPSLTPVLATSRDEHSVVLPLGVHARAKGSNMSDVKRVTVRV